MAADVDLLFGRHSAFTHSVGAALMVLLLALVFLPRRETHLLSGRRLLLAVALAAAYFAHPVLDWLGEDDSPPLGVMLLWPFSDAYFHSGLDWFLSIQRRYWLPGFWASTLRSIARELVLLGPLAALVLALRPPRK